MQGSGGAVINGAAADGARRPDAAGGQWRYKILTNYGLVIPFIPWNRFVTSIKSVRQPIWQEQRTHQLVYPGTTRGRISVQSGTESAV